MSVFNTSVSGMLADNNWLSTISQNVANANTTGFKNVETEFSSLVDSSPGSTPQVAGVSTNMISLNNLQGAVESTQTVSNLAVQGAGFFIVSDASGDIYLTRNGSFVPDAQGNLVNSAGYYLMGQNTENTTGSATVNSIAGLSKVNVQGAAATATASTTATIVANLPSTASIVAAANLPSTNAAGAKYTDETTLTAYDNLGGAHTLNLYFSNLGGGQWQVDAFDNAGATAGTGFPYSGGELGTSSTLTFNTTTGALTSGSPISIPVPGGATLSLDVSQTTQLASAFGVTSSTINGNAPGTMSGFSISASGVMSFEYNNGSSVNAFVIPLANVPSPDNLTSLIGGAYSTNYASGNLQVNNADSGGLGTINDSSLEGSTVDLAAELTNMIQAQSAYEANSKVFQTGANLFDTLNNLHA